MDNIKLREFVAKTAATRQITFGDLRRLQRNCLPGGISTCEEAKMLIQLDALAERADKAWTDWLVAAIVDFARSSERSTGAAVSGSREWVNGILAGSGMSTKAARRMARAIRRSAEPAPIRFPAENDGGAAEVVFSNAAGLATGGLELAA